MAYPYPVYDKGTGRVKTFIEPIPQLAQTKSGGTFCTALSSYSAKNLDKIKNVISQVRKGREYRSCDAFLENSAGEYVFIEFKKSTISRLQSIGRGGNPGPTIQVVLRQKSVDSQAVVAWTELKNRSMADIQAHAILIVVHKDDPTTKPLRRMARGLRRLSVSAVTPPANAILWGLSPMKSQGFYQDVFTWSESVFIANASRYLL